MLAGQCTAWVAEPLVFDESTELFAGSNLVVDLAMEWLSLNAAPKHVRTYTNANQVRWPSTFEPDNLHHPACRQMAQRRLPQSYDMLGIFSSSRYVHKTQEDALHRGQRTARLSGVHWRLDVMTTSWPVADFGS